MFCTKGLQFFIDKDIENNFCISYSLEKSISTSISGTFQVIKECMSLPVFVMIRPRGGDFLYSDIEFDVMRKEIEIFKEHKADGFVFGILNRFNIISFISHSFWSILRFGRRVQGTRFSRLLSLSQSTKMKYIHYKWEIFKYHACYFLIIMLKVFFNGTLDKQ